MEIEEIHFPDYLNDHTLTEQDLADMPSDSQARAKDRNITNRKLDWLIRETVWMHNVLVAHDKAIDAWKRVYWLFGLIGGSFVAVLACLQMTNDVVTLIAPAASTVIQEVVSWIITIAVPALIVAWLRSARKSTTKDVIIEAIVRGIEQSSYKIGTDETSFVKKAVQQQAAAAGVEQHLQPLVQDVKAKIAEEQQTAPKP